MSEQQEQHNEEPLTQVFVSNISPASNEQTLASFFSFCGTITNLKLTSHSENGTKEAIVSFENEAAAKTALLLTNAVIADRPITVVPYSNKSSEHKDSSESSSHTTEISGDQIPNKNPTDQQSHVSVIAGLLAAGYTLGSDAFAKAKQIDETNQLSTKLAAAAVATKEKFQAIDQTYHISEKVSSVVEGVTNKAKEVDQNWKISENVSNVVKNVTDTAEILTAKANENPAVQTTISTLSHLAENVSNYISPGIQAINQQISDQAAQIREETNHNIEEKMKAREVEKKSQQNNEEQHEIPIPNPNPNPNPTDSQPSVTEGNVEQK